MDPVKKEAALWLLFVVLAFGGGAGAQAYMASDSAAETVTFVGELVSR